MASFDWLAALHQDPDFLPAPIRAGRGGDVLLALLGHYQQTEQMSPEGLAGQQGLLLETVAGHCAAQSRYFARRLKDAGLKAADLARPGGLRRLPTMSRRQLVNAGKALFCSTVPAPHGRIGTTSTSGSTGEPVTLRRPELCQQHWMAHTLREHLWHRRSAAGCLAVVRANLGEVMRLEDWGPPINQVLRTGPVEGRPITASMGSLADWLVDYQPNELLMLPSSLGGVLELLEASGRRLEGIQAVRTLSETVTPRLRDEVRRILGVEIADVYSSQEGGVMATQCPEHGLYHVTETVLMEVLREDGEPCQPGEVGRVVITDLLNYGTPVIRYEIGDYAEAGPRQCACGRSSPTVRRFLGRERNLLLRPDGSRHWPTVGFHRWGEVLPIRQFQFIQEDRHRITVRFSIEPRPDPAVEPRLTKIIQSALGHDFEITYEWHEGPIPRGPGGKFEEFICRAT